MKQRQFLRDEVVQTGYSDPSWKSNETENQAGIVHIALLSVKPELVLPKRASLAIILAANVLLQISFFIIIPSANDYSQYLGGDSTFSGLTIGIPTIVSGLALIPLSRYDKGGYKLPLHVSCASCIMGHILYSLAYSVDWLYLILIGRIANGFAFAMLMYCKKYCSDPRIVGIQRRTTLAAFLIMGQGLGMTASPFFGGLLYKVGFRNPIFNGYTSPGWIMACIWGIFWICVIVWYEDVPRDQAFLPSSPDSKSMESRQQSSGEKMTVVSSPEPFSLTPRRIAVIVCMCWLAMTYFFVLGAWESNIPVFGSYAKQLHWSPFAAGNFIALGGAAAFPFLALNIYLARRVDDRRMLAFGTSLGLIGLFIFLALLETDKVNYASIFVCWWAVVLGFNTAFTVPVSLLSKQFPPSWNNRTSIVVQCSTFVGRVAGAIFGGSGVRIGMRAYVGTEIVLTGIGTLLYLALWRELKAKRG